ncbi:DUF1007 family protein [Ancylobacter dichloromethanicus]
MIQRLMATLIVLTALTGSALAHPHVWVEVHSELDYAPDGTLSGVRHHWKFDEAFSTYALQGLETTPDGKPSEKTLKDLAQVNIEIPA